MNAKRTKTARSNPSPPVVEPKLLAQLRSVAAKPELEADMTAPGAVTSAEWLQAERGRYFVPTKKPSL